MQKLFLTPAQLAARWNMDGMTLNKWRWNGQGPKFHKIGKRIGYLIQDVEAFEMSSRCQKASEHNPSRHYGDCVKQASQPLGLSHKKGGRQ